MREGFQYLVAANVLVYRERLSMTLSESVNRLMGNINSLRVNRTETLVKQCLGLPGVIVQVRPPGLSNQRSPQYSRRLIVEIY